jgi:hypothetical protein
MARRVVAPDLRISAIIGSTLPAERSASALIAATARSRATSMLGLPSLMPFERLSTPAALRREPHAVSGGDGEALGAARIGREQIAQFQSSCCARSAFHSVVSGRTAVSPIA